MLPRAREKDNEASNSAMLLDLGKNSPRAMVPHEQYEARYSQCKAGDRAGAARLETPVLQIASSESAPLLLGSKSDTEVLNII